MLSLKELKLEYITNEAGERTAVVFPIGEFQELLEELKTWQPLLSVVKSQRFLTKNWSPAISQQESKR